MTDERPETLLDPPGVKAPRQARSMATMEAFLEATVELLRERQFEDLAVTEIADRADRTVGSFYARFDDKDNVLHAVVIRYQRRLRDQIYDLTDPARWRRHQLPEIIEAWVGWTVAVFRHPRPEFSNALSRAGSDPIIRQALSELLREATGRCRALLADRADEFGVQPSQTIGLVVRSVVGVLMLQNMVEESESAQQRTQIELTSQLTGMALRILSGERPSGATLGLREPTLRDRPVLGDT